MAALTHVFKDSGLTQAFDPATDTLAAFAIAGDSDDGVFYVGLTDSANKLQADSNPGVDQIAVSITDAVGGSGVAAADIKLALTQGGLDGATGGASLNIGTTINGGAGNAVPVWFRWTNAAETGVDTDLSLELPAVRESAI